MKKVLLFAMLLLPQLLVAQDVYHTFTENHKVWVYIHPNKHSTYQFYTDGDTIVAGYDCMKLYSDNYVGNSGIKEYGHYHGALFDEGKKTYLIEAGSEMPRLLQDFDMEEGDSITGSNRNFAVNKIDTVSFEGRNFRRIAVSSEEISWNPYTGYCYEGIGSSGSYFLTPLYMSHWHPTRFGACYLDGELLFCDVDYWGERILEVIDEFKDIISGINKVTYVAPANNAIYDLSGRRVANSSEFQGSSFRLPKGVYIQNGKKVVVK